MFVLYSVLYIVLLEIYLNYKNKNFDEFLNKQQSLLYVHKCVRPACAFLNRMLDLLHHAPDPSCISLTENFRQFLPMYNGVSLYTYKELEACLTGLGGHCGNVVYHLPIPRGR